jgi:hypothetical protein
VVGIAGASLNIIFVMLIFKPVFSNMREDVFLKIGGNRNLWGKEILLSLFIDVYKYLTLSKSFLKLDFINCLEFMITGLFIWFTIFKQDETRAVDLTKDYILLAPEVFVLLLVLLNNIQGHYLVRKNSHISFNSNLFNPLI